MIPRSNLTEKQRAVLRFIEAYASDTGAAPDRHEISARMGWAKSNGYLCRCLAVLEERGFIARSDDGAIVLQVGAERMAA